MAWRSPVWALGALFIVACALFVNSTPYRVSGVLLNQRDPTTGNFLRAPDVGAPDERQHANYVKHLLDGNGFPVLRPGSADLGENYQSHQPPLAYLMLSGWARASGADPAAPSGVRLRWLNVLLGVATLLGVWYGAKVWSGSEPVALTAAAFCLMPMHVALSSAVSNDPLLFALCAWGLATVAVAIRNGWNVRLAVLFGTLAGLALLTKTLGLALLPVAAVALMLVKRGRTPTIAVVVLVLPVIVALPWLARNQQIYGDPLVIKAFGDSFTGNPTPADVIVPELLVSDESYAQAFSETSAADPNASPRDVIRKVAAKKGLPAKSWAGYWTQWVCWWTARSAIGVFGYMDIFLGESLGRTRSNSIYSAIILLLLLITAGNFWRRESPIEWKDPVGLAAITLAIVVSILFLRFNTQYFQGQARYLYPALAPAAWCLGSGWVNILKKQRHIAPWLVTTALCALLAASWWTINTGFSIRTGPG